MKESPRTQVGFAGRIAAAFINSKLTPLAIIASLLLGMMAVAMLPREEEPQIKVPMIDVMASMPGATPTEVEQRVTIPMEKLLYEVPGVEYIYSTSMTGQSLLIVRFLVGEDPETAIVRLNQKLATNFDRIPQGVTGPLVKPHTIDDVPIMALTFHGGGYDHYTLRRLAAQVDDEIKNIADVAETTLIGGTRRQLRVEFDPIKLAARRLTPHQLIPALQQANRQEHTGRLEALDKEMLVRTGQFLSSADEVGRVVVGVWNDRPVYLADVATIIDGPQVPENYVLYGASGSDEEAAVTLSVAKRPGTNAIDVVHAVEAKLELLKGTLIPKNMQVSVTRDYGKTAAEKSNELLLHMGIAVFGVALLILFFLGFRESLVVLLAIPSTLALTLLVFYLYGYTLNRITLFALIFSIGILVDDAIVVVENIVRHMRLPDAQRKDLVTIAVEAVAEVGNPTILATWAVIAAILPMAFVGGLMGPYMRPIPIGASAAMLFSLVIAFTVTPWAAIRLLKKRVFPATSDEESAVGPVQDHDHAPDDFFTRIYHRIMNPLLASRAWRAFFFGGITLLLLGSFSLVYFGQVKVKMLPFDNKSEFQVILNMPEGSTLEQTSRVVREMAAVVRKDPTTIDYQVYVGTAAPYNFNGLVRHYFMRSGPTVADIQVNLKPKSERSLQSHDIAVRVRPAIAAIAEKYGANVVVAEVPPGPPVLQTLVAEVYGRDDTQRAALARRVKDIFESTEGGVVDVDWYREAQRNRLALKVDKKKAALNGISVDTVNHTIVMAAEGLSIDLFHQPSDKEKIDMVLRLPTAQRSDVDSLLNIALRPAQGTKLVPLRELVTVSEQPVEQPIYRKNLKPVIYVTGDVAGSIESPAYAIFAINKHLTELKAQEFGASGDEIELFNIKQPFSSLEPAIKWDGEWHITLEVFRDLGLAFCVVMVLIYMLMVGWFRNYFTPLMVMAAIPFSLIGILPAHWAMGAFFTATSMIGFMAGAGIVVRNSIILVDFIELRISHGLPLAEAVVEAGAIRFRPMLLTALAVVVGASVILADPIFQGLAISLMFGEIASLLISRMAVPVLYYMLKKA